MDLPPSAMAIINLKNSPESPVVLFFLRGRDILLDKDGNLPVIPMPEDALVKDAIYDTVTGAAAVELSAEYLPVDGCKFLPLRYFFALRQARGAALRQAQEPAALAARMKGYINWRASVKFCPACGAALVEHECENARVCPKCGHVQYPRIEPCVIAVICRGEDEILLLRHVQRNQDIWCCLAGFVEAGESLEQALIRETREETGLEITNVRYFGSQSWPFPDQLMIGFYADWKSGEIRVQPDEIFEAKWFKKTDLPPHPAPGSISYDLIHGIITKY